MMMENDLTKLGLRFKVFAILTLVSAMLDLVDNYLLPSGFSISGYVSIPLLIFQILIIVSAKKSAKEYQFDRLNMFATLMIVSLVASFASVGLIFALTFVAVLEEFAGGGMGAINISPILTAGTVISLLTIVLELIAWIFMLTFFDHLEEIDARARGKPGAILAIVGRSIAIASSLIVGIPLIINNPTIDPENIAIVMPIPQLIASELLGIATTIVSVIGYFTLSQVFALLGSLRPQVPRFSTPSSTTSWAGRDAYGYQPPGAWDGRAGPTNPAASPPGMAGFTGVRKCPNCGATVPTSDPRAVFCGECGSKLSDGI
ncbi:MAG: zinc ribbon domain-containing protein [Candidatus Sigynarchaeum springense]